MKTPKKRADGTGSSTHPIVFRKIGDLEPWDGNPRQHNPEGTRMLADAIRKRGWTNPILINDKGVIIAGHGRRLAALELGGEDYEVPVIVFPGLDTGGPEFVAMAVADNQLATKSEWNLGALFKQLDVVRNHPVHDLPSMGFNLENLNELKTKFAKAMDEGLNMKKPPKEAYKLMIECNSEQERARVQADLASKGLKVKAK